MSTLAPSVTNFSAMPAPKPEAPPVMMAVFPFSRMVFSYPCRAAMVFSRVKLISASKPFSRP